MRTFITVTLSILLYLSNSSLQAQENWVGPDFRTDRSWIEIDTTNKDNIWEFGEYTQDTAFLFSGDYDLYSSINDPIVLATDINKPYPVNNKSSFTIKICKGDEVPAWSAFVIGFTHKFDTDSLTEGGYIEVSFNGGKHWMNIANDTLGSVYRQIGGRYNCNLSNGNVGFSGKTKEWLFYTFDLGNTQPNNCEVIKGIDSALVRFTFISDSIDTKKNGWIIKEVWLLVTNTCGVGISEAPKEFVKFFPNPAQDKITISLKKQLAPPLYISMFNTNGICAIKKRWINGDFYELDISRSKKGLYLIQIMDSQKQIITQKIIIE